MTKELPCFKRPMSTVHQTHSHYFASFVMDWFWFRVSCYLRLTFSAQGPFFPSPISNSTLSFLVIGPFTTAEEWTKRSLPPLSGAINPKPLSSLKNFTVPVSTITSLWLSCSSHEQHCVPYGIRTHVSTVKGWCPRPLDEGDNFVSQLGFEPRTPALKGQCSTS